MVFFFNAFQQVLPLAPALGNVPFTESLWSPSHITLWIRPVCVTSLKL